jgi:hypothetical protein
MFHSFIDPKVRGRNLHCLRTAKLIEQFLSMFELIRELAAIFTVADQTMTTFWGNVF